jgi:acyl-CoA hydrolase
LRTAAVGAINAGRPRASNGKNDRHIAVEAMNFIQPMRVGDVLEVCTEVESVGRTSMKIHVK